MVRIPETWSSNIKLCYTPSFMRGMDCVMLCVVPHTSLPGPVRVNGITYVRTEP